MNVTVDGVALATVISQAFSALMIMLILFKETGPLNFSFKKIKIHKDLYEINEPNGKIYDEITEYIIFKANEKEQK
mgnify:CR=1 FL=1